MTKNKSRTIKLFELPFKLPKDLVTEISYDYTYRHIYRFIEITPENFENDTEKRKTHRLISAITSGVMIEIESYYKQYINAPIVRKEKTLDNFVLDTQEVSNVFGEGLTNSIAHGPKEQNIVIYGLFYGLKGICHGFRNSGTYFTNQDIKEMFENHKVPTTFDTKTPGISGGHYGLKLIYNSSDRILVDTKQNTLFCVQYLNRIIDK